MTLICVQLVHKNVVVCRVSGNAAWTVHHVQNHTRLGHYPQPARRDAVLGQPTSLRPHWVELSYIWWNFLILGGTFLYWVELSYIGWNFLILGGTFLYWVELSYIGWNFLILGGTFLYWVELSYIGWNFRRIDHVTASDRLLKFSTVACKKMFTINVSEEFIPFRLFFLFRSLIR